MKKKKLDKIRNYIIEEINRKELMSKKHKKVCEVLSYIENSLIVISAINRCVYITRYTVGLKICVITTEIKKHKSINKKNKKIHGKIYR